MDRKILKFDYTETEEYEFHQHKSPISINNIDINKTVVLIKVLLLDKILNISLVTKMLQKIDLYTFCPEMSIYKTNVCMFFLMKSF